MHFKPCNRHYLIQPEAAEQSGDSPSILIPDEYRPKVAFVVAEVLAIADDCKIVSSLQSGSKILCNNTMIEEVKIGKQTYYLLLENHVLGLIS